MGFCRRCGEIVAGERCRCGGSPAAPIVAFKKALSDTTAQDKWTKTYVFGNRSPSPTRPGTVQNSVDALNRNDNTTSNPPSPTKRFPRPLRSSNSNPPQLSNGVSQYIASTTSARPRSPLKQAVTVADPSSDIIPSLVDNTLSKVYGSVLQPKETLSSYSCALCSEPFPPDATIYPDPSQPNASNSRFVCRPCYEENGGSKGPCGGCSRPVLTLKAEGGFVQAAGKYWHKRCFDCAGCFKNIGDRPMVDLLGHPCCADCFDNCLKRETPKKSRSSTSKSASSSNLDSPKLEAKSSHLGGISKTPQGTRTRESSPAMEELEQRLGIARNREGSPVLEELTQRLIAGKDINQRYSTGSPSPSPLSKRTSSRPSYPVSSKSRSESPSSSLSPVRRQTTGSPAPTTEAIEEMKQRLFKSITNSSSPIRTSEYPAVPIMSRSSDRVSSSARSSSSVSDLDSLYSPLPATPDLLSDFSDTTTQSSFSEPPDSPPRQIDDVNLLVSAIAQGNIQISRYRRGDMFSPLSDTIPEETTSQLNTPTKTPTKSAANTPSRSSVDISPLRLRKKASFTPKQGTPPPMPSSCLKCGGKLFTIGDESTFVTLPSPDKSKPPEVYHTSCFTCNICNGVFENEKRGQSSFIRHKGKPCHPECAPKERITIHKSPSSPALRSYVSNVNEEAQSPSPSPRVRSSTHRPVSSRFEQTALTAPSSNSQPAPRFGSRTVCPGCKKAVSPMECGVIPGPQATKWHSSCLVCGGKKARPVSWYGTRRDEKTPTPGCGKKLDSAAKSDAEGGVWCRECMLLQGLASSPQPSPVRTALSPTYTGSGKMVPQFTGTASIVRQFTGAVGGEAALLRQLTGGGLSPTRSISPTKQLGAAGANPVPGLRPRPKSVLGLRNTKSVDEGRGMFLVRQLTGASSSNGWGQD